jgi:Ser/Thr protein kinase RdoA (MazF antagonist)
MQDAGEAPYEYADPEHQRLAARWLARLHVGGSRIAEARSLPDRGPDHFLGRLRLAVDTLKARRETASANADLEILDGLLTQCEALELNWGEIEAFCSQLPRTIVHGDFAALNARVRSEGDEKTLLCFDWEKAGYGVPVVDMARGLDLEAYYSEVHHGWPALSLDDVRRMALVGRVFRPLSHNWARKTPVKLHDHYVHMQETLHKFGWEPREVRP